jgi:hypothetical protein
MNFSLQKLTARRMTLILVPIVLALSSAAMADCAADVPQHLNWCSTDHGFNEGATCGLRALSGLGLTLPVDVGEAILGNAWDRTNMMGATKAAFHAGFKEQAIDAAICCQVHNGGAHSCLSSNRDIVKQWLASH